MGLGCPPGGQTVGERWCIRLVIMIVLGWLGGFLIAGGYMLVSLGRLAPDSSRFQALNVVGAAMLGVSCVIEGSLPPACLNAVCLVFGVRSLVVQRTVARRRDSTPRRLGRRGVSGRLPVRDGRWAERRDREAVGTQR